MIGELQDIISLSHLRTSIQNYFWNEIFDLIGSTYKVYSDAAAKILNSDYELSHISMKGIVNADLEKMRGIPELAEEIEAHESFVTELKASLTECEVNFSKEASEILSDEPPSPYQRLRDNRYQRITVAFDQHLRPWFDARNQLTDERLRHSLDELSGSLDLRRAQAVLSMLKRIRWIRRMYVMLEIFAPVLFAACAVVFVYFLN